MANNNNGMITQNELSDSLNKKINDSDTNSKLNKQQIGSLPSLRTNSKDTLVNSINELFQYASNGKTLVANAITGKGIPSNSNMSFQQLATNISNIKVGYSREDIESGKVVVCFEQSKVFSNTGFPVSEFMNFKYPYINFKSGSFNIENGTKDNLFHYDGFSTNINVEYFINAYVHDNILYTCRRKSDHDYFIFIDRSNILTGESLSKLEINVQYYISHRDLDLEYIRSFYYVGEEQYAAVIDDRSIGYGGGLRTKYESLSDVYDFLSKMTFDPGVVEINGKSFIGTKINDSISCISKSVAEWDWVDGYGHQKSLFFIVKNNDPNLCVGSFENNNDFCVSYNNNIYIIKNDSIIQYSSKVSTP